MATGELGIHTGETDNSSILESFYPNFNRLELHAAKMGKMEIVKNPVVETDGAVTLLGKTGEKYIPAGSNFWLGEMKLVKAENTEQYGLLLSKDLSRLESYLFLFPPEGQTPPPESSSLKEYIVSLAEVVAKGVVALYGPQEAAGVELLRQDLDMGNRLDALIYMHRLGIYNFDRQYERTDFDPVASARDIIELPTFDNFDDAVGYKFHNGMLRWAKYTGLPYIKGPNVKYMRNKSMGRGASSETEDGVRTPTELCVQLLDPYKGRFHPAIRYESNIFSNPVIGLEGSENITLSSVDFPTMKVKQTASGNFMISLNQVGETDIEFPNEQGLFGSDTGNETILSLRGLDWYLRSLAVVGNGHIYENWGDQINLELTRDLDLSKIEHVLTLLGRQAQFIDSFNSKGNRPFNTVTSAASIARGPAIEDLKSTFASNNNTLRLGSYLEWKLGTKERPVIIGHVPVTSIRDGQHRVDPELEIAGLKAQESDWEALFEISVREIGKVSKKIRKIEQRYREYLLGGAYYFPSHSQLVKDLAELRELISDPRSSRNTIKPLSEDRARSEGISHGRLFPHYESEYRELESIPDDHAATIREESVRLASALFRKMVESNEYSPPHLRKSRRKLLFDHAPLRAAINKGTGGRVIKDDQHYEDLYSAFWELFPKFDRSISKWEPALVSDVRHTIYYYKPNPEIIEYADFLEAISAQGDTILNSPYPASAADENRAYAISMFGEQILPGSPLSVALPVTASFMRIVAMSMAIYPDKISTYLRLDALKATKMINDREREIQRILELLSARGNEGNARLFANAVSNMRYILSDNDEGGESVFLLSRHSLIESVFDKMLKGLTPRR